jgi:deferrochelatase/peroxidase EfeB
VPLGSRMRRMNPRDTNMAQLTDVNIHRIIRRSTTFGAPYDPSAISEHDDEVPRGIYFLFISAKAMTTMEFLQQEWINDGNFMSLGRERDPNVGYRRRVLPSRFQKTRSDDACTVFRHSKSSAVANTCSCQACRR